MPRAAGAADASTLPERSIGAQSGSGGLLCGGKTDPTGPGTQKLALLIAVDDYPQDPKWKLEGPVNDLTTFKELLVQYGYEEGNICELVDADATLENVAAAFKHVADRADSEDQVAVFFAGHGTQIPSLDGDEYPNDKDQALVLYDSDMPREDGLKQPYLVDDDLAGLLALVRQKTKNVTVVLDSCHSGSATRDSSDDRFEGARTVERLTVSTNGSQYADSSEVLRAVGASRATGYDSEWSSVAPEGTIVLAAARDGTLAYEENGQGAFTSSLVRAVADMKGRPMTLQMLERKMRSEFAGQLQMPLIHGDARSFLFSADKQPPVLALSVRSASDTTASLTGLRLATTGIGAELRIFDGSADTDIFDDPSKAKAIATVRSIDGPTVTVDLYGVTAPVKEGDLAIEVVPSVDAQLFDVDVSKLNADQKGALTAALKSLGNKGSLVKLIDGKAAFEVQMDDGKFIILGSDGRTRNRLERVNDVALSLSFHARQWSLLQLGGEGAGVFADNQSLKVKIIKPDASAIPNASLCKPDFATAQMARLKAGQDTAPFIPFCAYYAVEVSADIGPADNTEINVGAFVLAHDGSILALGRGQDIVLSKDKTSHRFLGEDVFQAFFERGALDPAGPLRIDEQVIAFGVDAEESIPWDLFGTEEMGRGVRAAESDRARSVSNPLFHQLDRYVEGTRTVRISSTSVQAKPWTVSTLPISIGLNPENVDTFVEGDTSAGREYTVNDFDLTPFKPADKASALYKVMERIEELTSRSEGYRSVAPASDGYPYTQHDWCEGSDDLNLEKGIDCSRSIWYSFTRSDLPYTSPANSSADRSICQPFGNGDNGYLVTAAMVGPQSKMTKHFNDCMEDRPFKTGDILVYRDDDRSVGHTVMVIDPVERIAWGSHGWDGNGLLGMTEDSGVEFQKILRKPDWGAWDRSKMKLKACWRYKDFSETPAQSLAWYDEVVCTDEAGRPCSRTSP